MRGPPLEGLRICQQCRVVLRLDPGQLAGIILQQKILDFLTLAVLGLRRQHSTDFLDGDLLLLGFSLGSRLVRCFCLGRLICGDCCRSFSLCQSTIASRQLFKTICDGQKYIFHSVFILSLIAVKQETLYDAAVISIQTVIQENGCRVNLAEFLIIEKCRHLGLLCLIDLVLHAVGDGRADNPHPVAFLHQLHAHLDALDTLVLVIVIEKLREIEMRSNGDVTATDQHTSRKLGELEIFLHIAFHRGTNKYFFHKNSPDLSFHSGVYPVVSS
nr:MAG TPA: hypothetical protein [Caudoviricetes sp.]